MEDVDPHAVTVSIPVHRKVKPLLIGEAAERCGVPAKTLRYYEDIGILDPAERSPAGYRHYDDGVIERVAFIRSAQAVGLTLGRSAV